MSENSENFRRTNCQKIQTTKMASQSIIPHAGAVCQVLFSIFFFYFFNKKYLTNRRRRVIIIISRGTTESESHLKNLKKWLTKAKKQSIIESEKREEKKR